MATLQETSLPSQCKVISESILGQAISSFDKANAGCQTNLMDCLATNATSCGVVHCDVGRQLLADACIESGGSYCTGVMSSPGTNGSAPYMSKFGMSTALCLPPGCGRSDVKAVSLHYIDQVCGSRAEAAECSLATDCDFEIGIGNTFAIIFGVCGTAAFVFLVWYFLRRWQKRSNRTGASATTRGLLAAADMEDTAPNGGTYAVLSPQPEETGQPAEAAPITYSVPPADTSRGKPRTTGSWMQQSGSNGAGAYSSSAAVGNDAVLESGASGL